MTVTDYIITIPPISQATQNNAHLSIILVINSWIGRQILITTCTQKDNVSQVVHYLLYTHIKSYKFCINDTKSEKKKS